MGFWKSGIGRSTTGEIRTEDDRTNQIKEFFESQEQVEKHKIVDIKNWVVDVEGSILLFESDLADGELFFKIGKLTGNLYCHCRHFKPSVIPTELGGEIIFVLDEEELAKYRTNSSGNANDNDPFGGMELLTAKKPSKSKVEAKLRAALSDCVNYDYDFDIDKIKKELEGEWGNRDEYQLALEIVDNEDKINHKHKYKNLDDNDKSLVCEFYVVDANGKTKLNLSAIEKALYILYILHKEGIEINMNARHVDEWKKIYSQIAGRVQDDVNGIMGDNFSITTINGYRSNIRTALKAKFSNEKVIDLFAIEGYKEQPCYVQKATDELREQIRQAFGL